MILRCLFRKEKAFKSNYKLLAFYQMFLIFNLLNIINSIIIYYNDSQTMTFLWSTFYLFIPILEYNMLYIKLEE